MPSFCTDPAQMEQFRLLLGLGLVGVSGLLLWDYIKYMTTTPPKPKYCPLHRVDRGKCADQHVNRDN